MICIFVKLYLQEMLESAYSLESLPSASYHAIRELA